GDDADVAEALRWIEIAWGRHAPDDHEAVAARVGELARGLLGAELPACAVHGDFWRGNIAHTGEHMRVYDWEWAELTGRPLFDLWTYELAELRQSASEPGTDAELEAATVAALGRVEDDLRAWGLDPRFARASLAPALAE